MLIDRNAPAIVGDGDNRILGDADDNLIAEPSQCLVNGVVDDLADKVM